MKSLLYSSKEHVKKKQYAGYLKTDNDHIKFFIRPKGSTMKAKNKSSMLYKKVKSLLKEEGYIVIDWCLSENAR